MGASCCASAGSSISSTLTSMPSAAWAAAPFLTLISSTPWLIWRIFVSCGGDPVTASASASSASSSSDSSSSSSVRASCVRFFFAGVRTSLSSRGLVRGSTSCRISRREEAREGRGAAHGARDRDVNR